MSTVDCDALILGGGHNGLVAASYLADAGMDVLLLERRDLLGGACATEELFPGYRFFVLLLHLPPAAGQGDRRVGPAGARV